MLPIREVLAKTLRASPPVARRDELITELRQDLASSRLSRSRLRARLVKKRKRAKRLRTRAKRLRTSVDRLRDHRRQLRARLEETRAQLRMQSEELAELRAREGQPSHRKALADIWRERQACQEQGGTDECLAFDNKLVSYSFAQSHGVGIPRLFGRWESIEELNPQWLATRPDRRMLKSAHGASAQGVVSTDAEAQIHSTIDAWRSLLHPSRPSLAPRIAPPFFTEERLIPDVGPLIDIKVYAFYGEVPLVMLVSPHDYRDRASTRTRFLSGDGRDLGPLSGPSRYDETISSPTSLKLIVDQTQQLSVALRRPFVRVDFYEVSGRVVLGEITPWPGQDRVFEPGFDKYLGQHWDSARVRLRTDIERGTSPCIEWGHGPRQLEFAEGPSWRPSRTATSDVIAASLDLS